MAELHDRITKFFNAIISEDIEEIKNGYVQDERTYVVLEGPRYSTKGYSMIAKGWGDFTTSPIAMTKIVWTEGPFEEIVGDMGWISGITELYLNVGGKEVFNTFRSSFVFKREDNDWKIRHEHVSAPHPDPYGVGDWLEKDK